MKKALLFVFLLLGLFQSCEKKQAVESTLDPESAQYENEINSPPEELKEVEWLTGHWQDQDDNIDVEYLTTWELNRNFLVQQFTVTTSDQPTLNGKQIIGWDPFKKSIRSWIFDSNGGFGHSTWQKENDHWYASVVFTLANGGRATATHVYTKIDESAYTFASVNRDIDGQLMPNIGPFKVVRKK